VAAAAAARSTSAAGTPVSAGVKPVIIALTEWGDRWVRPGPVVYRNEADGQPVELQLRRVGDDTRVAIADVVARRR
jgi:hypothetical protein